MNFNQPHSFNENFRIVKGEDIPKPQSTSNTNWAFTDLDFSKIEIIEANSNSDANVSSTKLSPKKLKNLMNNREALIVVYSNGFADNKNILKKKLSAQAYKQYKNQPCVVMSPNKDALMSLPIVPFGINPSNSSSNNYYDNGLVFPITKGFNVQVNGGREAKYYATSCNWIPSFVSNSLMATLQSDELGDTRFGTRQSLSPGAGYINMSSCKSILYDKQSKGVTAARRYVASLAKEGKEGGGVAISYKFIDCDPPQQGQIDSPILNIYLSDSSKSNTIDFAVGPNGKAAARVGTDVAIGEIGGNGNGALPPQAQAIGGSTVFMYPLYNGFVFSSNPEDGGLFVKYNEFQSYYNMIQISNANPTDEIKVDWMQNPFSKMQWFPALLQQSSNPSGLRLKLMQKITTMQKVKNKKDTESTSSTSTSEHWEQKTTTLKSLHFTNPKLEWWCSTGKFAYCPLFFTPEIEFDLYFKGQDGMNGIDMGTYYVYPIVSSADANKDAWNIYDNISQSGAMCLTANLVLASEISNSQQAIYKVHFSYKTKSIQLPSFPLQIFGCVIATHYKKPRISLKNSNSDFNKHRELKNAKYHDEFNLDMSNSGIYAWMDMITNVSIQSQFQGPTGSITFDEYALNRKLKQIQIKPCIGQLCLKVKKISNTPFRNKYSSEDERFCSNSNDNIFKGYALELRNQVSQGGQTIDFTLQGVQKKLQDMKLICAPYWDGDRLEMICRYFEQYCKIKIYMINYNTKNYDKIGKDSEGRLKVSYNNSWNWEANNHRMIGDYYANAPDFRVPRSFEYSKPAVDFPTNTSCLQALNRLAEMTSCALVIQPNGQVNFFELNDMGIPYYVEKQYENDEAVVSFKPQDIISLNISPYLENKYNYFVTFGLLKKRSKKTNKVQGVSVHPGIITTILSNSDSMSNFPWARPNVAVENGSLTPSELRYIHANNVMFGISDIYQGDVTVFGNTKINHLYQAVKICGVQFFVQSISHQMDLSTKTWTTSYGLTYFNKNGLRYDKKKNEFTKKGSGDYKGDEFPIQPVQPSNSGSGGQENSSNSVNSGNGGQENSSNSANSEINNDGNQGYMSNSY